MKHAHTKLALGGALALAVAVSAGAAHAADKITIASSHKGSWSTAMGIYAQEQGFFKAEGIEAKIIWTRGGSDAQQAIISNAAQIAPQTGILGVVSAYAKGAPIRIIGAAMTGSGGLYWYVKADSKLKSLKDATANHTMGFSRPGSSTNLVSAALKAMYKSKIKLKPAGGPTGTLTQVMSGQLDVGWASPPFGLDKVAKGEIRIIAKGDEVPSVKAQTIRVFAANANWLKNNRDVAKRAMRAMWKATEWIYKDPKAIDAYVKLARKVSKADAMRVRDEFVPLKSYAYAPIGDLDTTIKQALQFKRLKKPLTKAQIDDMIQIVYEPKLM
ncbi:MAG: ABC transporter substrate-binding protein [Alphaproteobacteria bacterium]|nr:ABC transporter substrate-binding protein [Alphaproteobacteria bacterium]